MSKPAKNSNINIRISDADKLKSFWSTKKLGLSRAEKNFLTPSTT